MMENTMKPTKILFEGCTPKKTVPMAAQNDTTRMAGGPPRVLSTITTKRHPVPAPKRSARYMCAARSGCCEKRRATHNPPKKNGIEHAMYTKRRTGRDVYDISKGKLMYRDTAKTGNPDTAHKKE